MDSNKIGIDKIKYTYMEAQLKLQGNHDPTTKDIMAILNLGPEQSGNYLREFKKNNPVKRW